VAAAVVISEVEIADVVAFHERQTDYAFCAIEPTVTRGRLWRPV
jgi:hypothetical protein